MRPFKYTETSDAAVATRAVATNPEAKFLAGGTNLVDLMREYIAKPNELVDIKPLAITTEKRRPELPNVPTTAESGFPGVGTNAWNGLFAPAGIPKPLLKRIHADVLKVMESPEMKASLEKVFMAVVVNKSPEEFQRFVLEEIKNWGKIVIDNDIKVE